MSNPNLEPKVKELMELRRMKEELDNEIVSLEDEIKQAMRRSLPVRSPVFCCWWLCSA